MFRIELDQPSGVPFAANDVVSGKVVLQILEDQHIGRVTIEFFGRCKTKIVKRSSNAQGGSTTHTYRGRADYFRYRAKLYEGKWTVRPDRYEWPFQFTFPESARATSDSGDWAGHACSPFQHLPGHALPPTFSWSSGREEAFVEYKLEARLERPPEHQSIFSNALEKERPLLFLPRLSDIPRDIPYSSSMPVSFRSLQLQEGRAGTALSFREQCRSLFKSGELPVATFALQIHTTKTAHLGEPFLISLALKRIEGAEFTSPTAPIVFLRDFEFSIKAVTDFRTIPTGFTLLGSEHTKHDETDAYHQSRSPRLAFDKLNDYTIKIRTEPLQPRFLQPSFRTYGIVRTYRLKFKATLSCVDKEVKIERRFEIIVRPPKPEGAVGGAVNGAEAGSSSADVPLPRYEEVVAPAGKIVPQQDEPLPA